MTNSQEKKLKSVISSEDEFAIFILSSEGKVTSWNPGAEQLTGYLASDIIGQYFTIFQSAENLRTKKFVDFLKIAAFERKTSYLDWHNRKDGSRFWANLVLNAMFDQNGAILAYSVEMSLASPKDQVTEELRARNFELEEQLDERTVQLGERTAELNVRTKQLGVRTGELGTQTSELGKRTNQLSAKTKEFNTSEARNFTLGEQLGERTTELGVRTEQLGMQTDELGERTTQLSTKTAEFNTVEALNKELEAFTYAASHDLRAPLRSIDGFSLALLEDYNDKLDAEGQSHLKRIRACAQRMGQLIDDLIGLSALTKGSLQRTSCDLSLESRKIAIELHSTKSERDVVFEFGEPMVVDCDIRLMRIVLENLLGNAFKYTSKRQAAKIEVGCRKSDARLVYFVRDNGAGFDMKYVHKLFGPFQRLHGANEFEGNGIGLATVQRIINRHGGQVWAESEVDKGTTVFFTL
jgi:PAS domain S-box-containing protein